MKRQWTSAKWTGWSVMVFFAVFIALNALQFFFVGISQAFF